MSGPPNDQQFPPPPLTAFHLRLCPTSSPPLSVLRLGAGHLTCQVTRAAASRAAYVHSLARPPSLQPSRRPAIYVTRCHLRSLLPAACQMQWCAWLPSCWSSCTPPSLSHAQMRSHYCASHQQTAAQQAHPHTAAPQPHPHTVTQAAALPQARLASRAAALQPQAAPP